MIILKKILKAVFWAIALMVFILILFSFRKNPEKISYGVSFSKFRAEELGLSWKDVFISILDDLKVRNFRLSAHWPMIEPQKDNYNFEELDFQIKEAEERNAEVILAVGKRLPSWPECHIPDWAKNLSSEEQEKEILIYIEKVIERYKSYENIKYWQVENEPYLSVFAKEQCGDLDEEFLKEEIALVKKLDPQRKVLITDSGNLGLWYKAWARGDVFGTSVYIYLWNPEIGQIKTIYKPFIYKAKTNISSFLFGKKEALLIELSLEPWLIEPINNVTLETQISRMDINKFAEVIDFAKRTGFDRQYLWGVEWWHWMKDKGYSEYFDEAKNVFSQ
ncbi:MAG: beta-galactosidase [Patescibacteria group bacterium]